MTRLVARFGVVGLLAFVVDVGVFNLLRLSDVGPVGSKTVSVVVAATVAWLGNRHWTFDTRRARHPPAREFVLFFVFNAVGLGISLACLGFTTIVLGLHDPLSENLSGNVVGLGLGTLFRLWAYHRWVFPEALA